MSTIFSGPSWAATCANTVLTEFAVADFNEK